MCEAVSGESHGEGPSNVAPLSLVTDQYHRTQVTDRSREHGRDRNRLKDILQASAGPYPAVVLPPGGDYWVDHPANLTTGSPTVPCHRSHDVSCGMGEYELECDETAHLYRKHFLGKEHFNFYAFDETHGPLILSVKSETLGEEEHSRIVLRKRSGTLHDIVPSSIFGARPHPGKIAKVLCEDVSAERFHPVLFPKGSELLLNFDEHVISNTFKFGVIYQTFGQTTEEELFANSDLSPALDEFLQLLGSRVKLKDFTSETGSVMEGKGKQKPRSRINVSAPQTSRTKKSRINVSLIPDIKDKEEHY
ncbi:Rap1 GTPase-activating protein 1 [Lamellibrachia satsuma]|nr:Rap1 GTPase-activating protein 1 [Lamellibrachia satsuma]